MKLMWKVCLLLLSYEINAKTIISKADDPINLISNKNSKLDNESPIIGILSQEVSYALEQLYPGMYGSFIAASYVKFVEGAGARVVPIWIGKEEDYYVDIINKINGVLLPGGASWFNQSNGYADAGEIIYKIAKQINDAGDYFPIWGTCLGFELLTYLSANRQEHRSDCRSSKQALHLDFKKGFNDSRMFMNAPEEVISVLANEAVTSNFHQFCVTEANLTRFNLDTEWKVLSVNDDFDGFNFISSIEAKGYPFYGTQFHPEKNIYEWAPNRNVSHSKSAILANRYFADFFIGQARQSHHIFNDSFEEKASLIYNFPTTYTALSGSTYEQCYFFA